MRASLLITLACWISFQLTQAQSQVNNLGPSLSPQSPNVSTLGRFGEQPVSLHTGIPSITVPVFDIAAGSVKVPVSLDYHAGGIKVTDQASWVGLGWALNAGGVISRTIIGIPDDPGGILAQPLNLNLSTATNPSSNNNDCDAMYAQLESMNKRLRDTGYDIFNLILPGGRNLKFMLIADGTGSAATTMPYERVKITLGTPSNGTGVIISFTVVDEAGITYTFEATESITPDNGSNNSNYTSAWLLTKIQGTRPNELVQFTYYPSVTNTSSIDVVDTQTIVDQVSGDCHFGAGDNSASYGYVSPTYVTRPLQEIVFPGGKLSFIQAGATRADIPGQKALDYIDVFGYNVNTNSFQQIKRIDLQQTYFPNYQSQSGPLKLNAVYQQNISNGIVSKYLFDYNMTQNLPGPLSRSRDTWGYFNGIGNNTLIPSIPVPLYDNSGPAGSQTIGGGIRSCNETYMQAWVLNKITYPTGGYSRYYYEANRHFDQATNSIQQAGGLRVTRIETQPSTSGPLRVKTYRYGIGENGYGTLNTNLSKSIWSTTYTEKLSSDCTKQTRVFSSVPTSSLVPFDGSAVTYSEVAEYEGISNGSNANGKTVYTFRIGGDIPFGIGNNSGRIYIASYHWNRNQLLTKTVYNQANQMLYRLVNTYSNPIKTEVPNAGVLIHKPIIYTTEYYNYYQITSCNLLSTSYIQPAYYYWPKGNIRLSQTDEYQYPAGGSNPIVTTTETTYNADFLPDQQTVTAADGRITIRKMRYPSDFTITGTPTGPALGVKMLQNRGQRNTVLEEYAYQKSSATDTTPFLTGGQLTLYEENSAATGYTLPKETYRLQVLDRCCQLSSYAPLTFSSSAATKDSRYGLELTYTVYDSRANPLEYLLRNGLRTRLEWGTYTNGGMTFSVVNSETANYNTSTSLTTRYAYDVPLLGLKTTTDPNGFATRYEYDSFGRLDAIRDHDQNLLKSFDYNFANGEQNPKKLTPFSTVNSSAGNGCFLIYNSLSGKVFQAMGDNLVLQQTPVGGQNNQIWRFEQQGNGAYKLTTQNGSGLALQANTTNDGEWLRIGNYSGTNLQLWNFNETTSGSKQYRVSLPTGSTWDVEGGGAGAKVQLYGNISNTTDVNYNNPFRFFQLLTVGCPGCSAPIPSLSASSTSICPGQTTTLTASGCSGGTVTWSTGAVGSTVTVNNGGTYLATCTLNGCTSGSGQVTVQTSSNCSGGSSVGNGCFTIASVYSNKVMQVMSDNTVQQQLANSSLASQIWKFEQQGNGQYKLTSQNGSGQVASVNAASNADQVRLSSFTSNTLQLWNFTETASGSGQYRIHLAAGNTWDMRSKGVDPELQLYGNMQNPSDPDYSGNYRIFRLNSVGCPTAPNCYSIRLVGNGKRLTNANGSLKIQDPDDTQNSQIWKIDAVGSSVKVTSMSGSGQVIGTSGGSQTVNTELVLQSYSAQPYQLWSQQVINDSNPGTKYGFVSNNGSFAWSSVYNWGGGDPSAPTVSDLKLVAVSEMQTYGWMKWYLDNRTCPF